MTNTGLDDFKLEPLCTKCQGPLKGEAWVFNMNAHNNQFCSRHCMAVWARRKGVDKHTLDTLSGN